MWNYVVSAQNSTDYKVSAFKQGTTKKKKMEQKVNIDQFKGQGRLPKYATPSQYDLHLKLDLSACTFSGTVKVNLSITQKTNFLVLNVNELHVHEALFTTSGNQVIIYILWLITINLSLLFCDYYVVLFSSSIVPLMLLWMMMTKYWCWPLMNCFVLEKGCWRLSFLGNLMSTWRGCIDGDVLSLLLLLFQAQFVSKEIEFMKFS